jgi:hypothetical protein
MEDEAFFEMLTAVSQALANSISLNGTSFNGVRVDVFLNELRAAGYDITRHPTP